MLDAICNVLTKNNEPNIPNMIDGVPPRESRKNLITLPLFFWAAYSDKYIAVRSANGNETTIVMKTNSNVHKSGLAIDEAILRVWVSFQLDHFQSSGVQALTPVIRTSRDIHSEKPITIDIASVSIDIL